jgi:hypothetical protein
VLNPENQPLYIHCNQGRHRTGCVVGCLRKLQQWPLDEILAEYQAYASPKTRSGDIEFITDFEPECLVQLAQDHEGEPFRWSGQRITDVEDVYRLAEMVLPAHNLAQLYRRTAHETFRCDEDDLGEDSEELRLGSEEGSIISEPLVFRPQVGNRELATLEEATAIEYAMHRNSAPLDIKTLGGAVPAVAVPINSIIATEPSTIIGDNVCTIKTHTSNSASSPGGGDYSPRGRTAQMRRVPPDTTISTSNAPIVRV